MKDKQAGNGSMLKMFIKQLKHDLLFSRNAFLGMGALLLGMAIVLRLTFPEIDSNMVAITIFAITIIAAITISVVTSIFQIYSFYKRNFFGNSGYLMLTLPVSRASLLASKLVVSMIWVNFMTFVGLAMVFIIAWTPSMEGVHIEFSVMDSINELIRSFVLLNVFMLFCIAVLFMSITLSKSKIAGFRINGIVAGVVSVLYLVLAFYTFGMMHDTLFRMIDFSTITHFSVLTHNLFYFAYIGLFAVFAAGAIAITIYLLNKRVNLQ